MADLYTNVTKVKPNRSGKSLKIALVLAILLLVVSAGLILWGVRYHRVYQGYVSELSTSTTYAYSHHSLHGQVAGAKTPVWVSGENVYKLYNYIVLSGSGREKSTLPEGDPAISLDYGDGSSLTIWEVPAEGYGVSKENSLFLSFQRDNGYRYAYTTNKMSLSTLTVNFLSLEENVPWAKGD